MDVSGVRTASRAGHGVQFFEHDRQWCDVVTRYVREGLAAGQCLVLVLTAEHRELLLQSCRTEKLDVERAWAEQRLVTLDANELLDEVMVGSMPAWEPFERILNATLGRVREAHAAPIHIYGEMVDLLWQRGNPAAARHLEAMCETLGRLRHFSLLCT